MPDTEGKTITNFGKKNARFSEPHSHCWSDPNHWGNVQKRAFFSNARKAPDAPGALLHSGLSERMPAFFLQKEAQFGKHGQSFFAAK